MTCGRESHQCTVCTSAAEYEVFFRGGGLAWRSCEEHFHQQHLSAGMTYVRIRGYLF